MTRGTLDLTRITPDLRGSPCQGRRPGSEQPMHNMGAQLLAQLVRIADRLGFVLWAAPDQGRSKLTNVALAASSVRLYRRTMDQFPGNGVSAIRS